MEISRAGQSMSLTESHPGWNYFAVLSAFPTVNNLRMDEAFSTVRVLEHPLVATKLSLIRAKGTTTAEFRRNLQELSVLLLVEASRTWDTTTAQIETPLTVRWVG